MFAEFVMGLVLFGTLGLLVLVTVSMFIMGAWPLGIFFGIVTLAMAAHAWEDR